MSWCFNCDETRFIEVYRNLSSLSVILRLFVVQYIHILKRNCYEYVSELTAVPERQYSKIRQLVSPIKRYHTVGFDLEESSEESPPKLMSPSVCPFHMKTRRIFTQELKSGCPRGVFCPSSIPSEYLFLRARRKFRFNKKIRTKLLIVYVYFQPNSCNAHADSEWARGTFLRQRRKVPPAHVQRVFII